MRRSLLALLLLLAACAPSVETPSYPPAKAGPGVLVLRDEAGRILLNPDLGLFAPAGSVLLAQSYQGEASKSRFTSPESFDRVLRWLEEALWDLGYRLEEVRVHERPPERYEATLVVVGKGKRRVVRLVYRSGVFDLEVAP